MSPGCEHPKELRHYPNPEGDTTYQCLQCFEIVESRTQPGAPIDPSGLDPNDYVPGCPLHGRRFLVHASGTRALKCGRCGWLPSGEESRPPGWRTQV